MVHETDPVWELREATPVERGFCPVYRFVVDEGGAPRECYLKASPDGRAWGIPTEARIQAVLDDHTTVPVPEVLSVTDSHDTLPTPIHLTN